MISPLDKFWQFPFIRYGTPGLMPDTSFAKLETSSNSRRSSNQEILVTIFSDHVVTTTDLSRVWEDFTPTFMNVIKHGWMEHRMSATNKTHQTQLPRPNE